MIIFTISNTVTKQVYVAMAKDSSAARWRKITAAAGLGIDADIYRAINKHGVESFEINDWAFANDREELQEMLAAAVVEFDAVNLQGLKTASATAAPVVAKKVTAAKTAKPVKKAAPALKISSGRVSSSAKEKLIREGIAKEKLEREALQAQKAAEQADEMKALMAAMDARSAGARRR